MSSKRIIWQITDGKPGHENQSAGLILALAEHASVETVPISVKTAGANWVDVIIKRFPPAQILPTPDLIIGAGSRTHKTLLAAKRATGKPAVVLMTPASTLLPLFDLCIAPEHDQRKAPNIITSKGALNRIQPSTTQSPDKGLFLIGGPSTHHGWQLKPLLEQISTILSANSSIEWTLTTSRRTPTETTQALLEIPNERLKVVLAEATDRIWLPNQLNQAGLIWATEDSVSMVYEALSSGARVGVLPVPRQKAGSRVIRGLEALIEDRSLVPFRSEQADLTQHGSSKQLNEATRIAKIIAERFW